MSRSREIGGSLAFTALGAALRRLPMRERQERARACRHPRPGAGCSWSRVLLVLLLHAAVLVLPSWCCHPGAAIRVLPPRVLAPGAAP
ncbi:MAG TPA: hypothetical protein VI365_30340 [Trebonia sp.]